jgi:hypothetical protein
MFKILENVILTVIICSFMVSVLFMIWIFIREVLNRFFDK